MVAPLSTVRRAEGMSRPTPLGFWARAERRASSLPATDSHPSAGPSAAYLRKPGGSQGPVLFSRSCPLWRSRRSPSVSNKTVRRHLYLLELCLHILDVSFLGAAISRFDDSGISLLRTGGTTWRRHGPLRCLLNDCGLLSGETDPRNRRRADTEPEEALLWRTARAPLDCLWLAAKQHLRPLSAHRTHSRELAPPRRFAEPHARSGSAQSCSDVGWRRVGASVFGSSDDEDVRQLSRRRYCRRRELVTSWNNAGATRNDTSDAGRGAAH